MNLNRLSLLATLAPAIFVVAVVAGSFLVHDKLWIGHWQEHILMAVAILLGIFPFSFMVFRVFRGMARRMEVQNQELSRRTEEMEALLKVGRAVEGCLDMDMMLPAALEAILQATNAEVGEVWLLNPLDKAISLRCLRGVNVEAFREVTRFRLGEGYPGIVAKTGRSILVHDLPNDPQFARQGIKAAGFYTYYGLPLRRVSGEVTGVLGVAARDSKALTTEDELGLLQIMADRIAAAVENALLHEEVQTLAALTERERIAREMHDGLAQVLGYVNTKAQAVKELLDTGQIQAAATHMEQLESAAQRTYDDVREAILALGTNEKRRSLDKSLKVYVERFAEMSGIPTELVANGTPWTFNPGVELQLLRIVQEALSNARKHAQAKRIKVRLSYDSAGCCLMVEDDGHGFDPARLARGRWPHFGLYSMQERAAAIGARFALESAVGKGSRVIVNLAGPAR